MATRGRWGGEWRWAWRSSGLIRFMSIGVCSVRHKTPPSVSATSARAHTTAVVCGRSVHAAIRVQYAASPLRIARWQCASAVRTHTHTACAPHARHGQGHAPSREPRPIVLCRVATPATTHRGGSSQPIVRWLHWGDTSRDLRGEARGVPDPFLLCSPSCSCSSRCGRRSWGLWRRLWTRLWSVRRCLY